MNTYLKDNSIIQEVGSYTRVKEAKKAKPTSFARCCVCGRLVRVVKGNEDNCQYMFNGVLSTFCYEHRPKLIPTIVLKVLNYLDNNKSETGAYKTNFDKDTVKLLNYWFKKLHTEYVIRHLYNIQILTYRELNIMNKESITDRQIRDIAEMGGKAKGLLIKNLKSASTVKRLNIYFNFLMRNTRGKTNLVAVKTKKGILIKNYNGGAL